MNLDDLYQRKSVLQREYEDADDRVTSISLAIDKAGEALQEAKSDYLIDPSSSELASKLKSAQSNFDSLVDEESIAIRGRNDLVAAVTTISSRINTQEAVLAQQAKSILMGNIPAKITELETEVLRSMAFYQAAQSLQGGGRSEPQLAILRLINSSRDEYLSFIENAKESLTEELSYG